MTKKLTLFLFFIGFALGHTAPNFTQGNYRWRNDDGGETTATWKASVNTSILPNDTDVPLRLRIGVLNDGNNSGTLNTMPLQYSKNNGAWVDITTSNLNDFYFINSSNVTDGSPTTQQIYTNNFIQGYFRSSATNNTINLSDSPSQNTEMEFCIARSSAYDSYGTYRFRINNLNSYVNYPTLNPVCTLLPPTVPYTELVYNLNQTAFPLEAVGTNILWYTSETGGTGSTVTPTPDTSVLGVTSYWVSQTENFCENQAKMCYQVVTF